MRPRHPALQAKPLGLVGQLLDMPRQRIVGLVAMHVDHQPALGGDFAELGHRSPAIGHGALEMRNATDDIDAEIERPDGVLAGARRPVETVLRKRHKLQIDVMRDLLPDFEQGLHRQQPVVADIDMGTDGQQAPWKPPSRNRRAPFPSPLHGSGAA
jgi:hypothetical protein